MAAYVYDWSATAASNATLDGMSVAEGMARANVSNSIRSLMEGVRRLYDWWGRTSVKRYGAVGDGTTDDTTAINNALASGAKALWFPAGTYKVTGALTIANNVRWYGEGYEASIISSTYNGFIATVVASNKRLAAFDMAFVDASTNAASGGFSLYDTAGYGFHRCRFYNFAKEGLRLSQAVQVTIDDCIFDTCGKATTSTVTITNATPGVVTWAAHGLANGTPILFTTTGALPTGLTVGTAYFVRNAAANTFELATASGAASSVATSSAGSGVHTAKGFPYAAFYNDPGATANVQINVRGGYIAACGIGFYAKTTRTLHIVGTTFESNSIGAYFFGCDGKLESRYFEANTLDVLQSDSNVKLEDGVSATMQLCWDGVGGQYRAIESDRKGFIEVMRTGTITPGSTAWEAVPFTALGQYYRATCAVAPTAAVVLEDKGIFPVNYRITFLADASARSVAMRLTYATSAGGSYTEVPGSYVSKTLASGETDTLTGTAQVNNSIASGAVKLEYSVSNVAVTIATGVSGTTAPTSATLAKMDVGNTGTEK